MNLNERINVLIQATKLSQKNGALTLDDAVRAKNAIDTISSGILNQNFTEAIKTLIEIVVLSQKKGVYSLKDAHMVYLAIENIETELNNEAIKIAGGTVIEDVIDKTETKNIKSKESIISVPSKTLKKDN